jgi:hypothetical protein
MFETLEDRCNAIEECYEFMLAYAAQGLPSDAGNNSGSQLRVFLQRSADALSGISAAYGKTIRSEGIRPVDKFDAFLAVLERDANDALAAVELVLAQPALSSQLIDNLNASIHLRALLTDLFLIDEVMKLQRSAVNPAAAN